MTDAERAVGLERVAIEVPDLDQWIVKWESIVGPGFEQMTVSQPTGDLDIAIHPCGLELVQSADGSLRLRSFHLAALAVGELLPALEELGWTASPGPVVAGRPHHIVSAEGLRFLLIETGG